MTIVNQEVEYFANKHNTYIFGDFNARTKTECENIVHDKSDDDLEVPTGMSMENIPLPRNSEDKNINSRGKEFLDLCRMNDLCIANGRTIGDVFGRYTCHQPRGSSVVDYLITPFQAYTNVTEFSVGEYLPSHSDHCPLIAKININQTTLVKEDLNPVSLYDLPPRYIWKQDDSKTFKDKMESNEFKEKVQNIMRMKEHENMVYDVQNLLTETAEECKIRKTKNKPRKSDPPWFDEECKELKIKISNYGKSLRLKPEDPTIREQLYVDKRKFRNLVRKNKYQHRKSIVDTMCENLSSGEKKEYWKMLRKLEKQNDKATYMHEQHLINHFKEILNDPNREEGTRSEPDNVSTPGNLDQVIVKQELDVATKILRNGKSPGIDTILNEMIIPLVDKYPKLILKLFNGILSNTWICKDWLISLITAIHKKGPKENPANYRGISLMSCLGKLFLTIINNRLAAFAVERNILSTNQLGFVPSNRTSDPHIILNNLVQKYCHKKKGKMYGCFVDFSKAFDSVPREILLDKLRKCGINGKVFEVIRKIYTEDQASVKFGNKASEPFKTNRGVRQGCVLSPLLFNIFLADIQEVFDKCGDSPQLNNMEISCMIWADDILILSETPEGLQAKINNLKVYCKKNKLQVNIDKTKVMTFTKSGRLLKNDFYFGSRKLLNIREYKYLGFIVTPSGEIRTGLEDLRIRAMRALTKIRQALGPLFQQNIKNTMHLYNFMVKPILLYTSDFWGSMKHPQNSPIERLHLSFYKQLLGVKKQTNTYAVHLETGTVPLIFHGIKSSVKNWERIREKRCNTVLTAAYEEATKESLPWITSIKDKFEQNGLLQLFYDTETEVEESRRPYNQLYKRLGDQYQQNAFEDIKRESGKLSLYSKLKTQRGIERYLTDISNVRHRTAMTRLRMSSHPLSIEEGRYASTTRGERICPLCKKGVEDEVHFLVTCPMYKSIKHYISQHNNILSTNTITDQEKTIKLLTLEDLKTVAKYIFEAFETRNIMIDALSTLNDITDEVEKQEKATIKLEADVKHVINGLISKIENREKSSRKKKHSSKKNEKSRKNKKRREIYSIKNTSEDGLKITLTSNSWGPNVKCIKNDLKLTFSRYL